MAVKILVNLLFVHFYSSVNHFVDVSFSRNWYDIFACSGVGFTVDSKINTIKRKLLKAYWSGELPEGLDHNVFICESNITQIACGWSHFCVCFANWLRNSIFSSKQQQKNTNKRMRCELSSAHSVVNENIHNIMIIVTHLHMNDFWFVIYNLRSFPANIRALNITYCVALSSCVNILNW